MPTDSTTQTRAQLMKRRQRLALEAAEGKRGAARELEDVEQRLAALGRDEERRALADRERVEREAQAQAEREEARRRELEATFERLRVQRAAVARDVELATDGLVGHVERLIAIGREMYTTGSQLGSHRPRLLLDDAITNFITWKLAGCLRVPRPPREHRIGLVEYLGGPVEPDGRAGA